MDDNNELIIYVLQQLRYGVPGPTIRATLAQNGWPQPLIDRAFSMVEQAHPGSSVPATDFTSQETSYGVAAADLPTPAEPINSLPLPDEPQLRMPAAYDKPKQPGKRVRKLLIALIILIFVAGLGVAGFFAYKALTKNKHQQTTSQSNSAKLDATRKQKIDQLAKKLQGYYAARHTYPVISEINNDSFASSNGGFDTSTFHDPSWDKSTAPTCTNPQGKPVFVDVRTNGCFNYRVTAMSGADCNANDIACARVVLTANLSGDKPYIVALDQNVKE